jgi:hypothetical protein
VARPRVSAAVLLLCGLLGWCGPVLAAERAAPGLGLTVVLVADCAADPEACATMRAALAQLEKVPRRHRALAAPGTRALAAALEDLGAPGVLGVLEIASAGPAGAARSPEGSPPAGARAGLELARGAGRRELTPAWLVDAVLRAGATTGLAPVVEPATAPWGQLVARLSRPAVPAAADAALAAGVPAIRLLVPPGRDAAAWVGATVRRLEGLGERPRPETEYFALSGRVWTRPALYWLGGPLWVALVIAGRPGVWRRTTAERRRRRGRRYLRALPLRVLFLAALLWSPVLALSLLGPAAATALWSGGAVAWRVVRRVLALAPPALLLAATGAAVTSGDLLLRRPGPTALLFALALAARELHAPSVVASRTRQQQSWPKWRRK